MSIAALPKVVRTWSIAGALLLAACSVYDDSLLLGGAGGGGQSNAGAGGGGGDGSRAGDGGTEQGGNSSAGAADVGGADASGGSPQQAGAGGSEAEAGQSSGGGAGLGSPSSIDSFEDGDFQIDFEAGRHGDWFVANDGSTGATIFPETFSDIPSELAETDPRAADSSFALHTFGSGFSSNSDPSANWGALVGCNLKQMVEVKDAYDASAYCALRFAIRGSFANGDSNRPVQVRISDQWTIPDAGQCGVEWNCNAHAWASVPIPEVDEWSTVEISFDDLTHPSVPDHAALDKTTLYSIEFGFQGKGAFDVWIDDVAFVECP